MPTTLAHRATPRLHIATTALASTFVLALIALVSAPLGAHTLLTVHTNAGDLRLGVRGYCLEKCTISLPYDLAAVQTTTGYPLDAAYSRATAGLGTIPAAVAMTGLAALLCALSTILPVLLPALVACILALLLILSGSVSAWALFGSLATNLADAAVSTHWGAGTWCLVAACPLVFVACGTASAEWVTARRRSRDEGVYCPLKGAKHRPYQF